MKFKGIASLAGFMLLWQISLVQATENPLLRYVPADSLFFTGNTELINISDYPLLTFTQSLEPPMTVDERQSLGREFSFFYELYMDFERVLQKGNQAIQKHYGLADEIASVAYTVGATPVIKFNLKNKQAFLNILDNAEQKSGFQHTRRQFGGLDYRSYAFDQKHELIISMQDYDNGEKLATFALLSQSLTEDSRQLIFGSKKPVPSLAEIGKLKVIEQENNYLPLSVSFLDFELLVRSLFKTQDNHWIELLGSEAQAIKQLQASQCEADVLKIAKEMPKVVAGYKNYQVQGQRINADFEVLLELKNQNVKAELNQFRGFIPDYIRSGAREHILAFAMGANMSQLSPMFFYITKAFRESTFQCPELIEMQNEVVKLNPAMLALVTGIVDGIQGLSFALQEFKLSTDNNITRADMSMILSLTAERPLQVWQMLSAFIPDMAMVRPSPQPQKLKSVQLDNLGLELFVVTRGQHLALYSGKQAEVISQQLMDEKVITNGLFQESLNYTRLTRAVEQLKDFMVSSDASLQLPAETCNYFDESIELLSRMSGFVDFQSDFVSNGWLNVLSADIELMAPKKNHYHLTGKFETHYVEDGCQLARDGLEEILADGTGIYQQYSDDGQCFIFETRYRWQRDSDQINLQYVSERSRADGLCANKFSQWSVPEAEFINDICLLRPSNDGDFACLYHWDNELTKSVYKRIEL